MSEELQQLKERADQLGIPYKGNIGVEALRNKVNAKLAGKVDPGDDDSDGLPNGQDPDSHRSPGTGPKVETEQQIRERIVAEATKLVRCRITNLNPAKAAFKGEIITVGNRYTGAISKFVAFGEATDEGYHIPKIIFDELKQRKFNSLRSEKGANGVYHPVQRLVPEFAIEVLDPLTPEELEQLARKQAAAAGL